MQSSSAQPQQSPSPSPLSPRPAISELTNSLIEISNDSRMSSPPMAFVPMASPPLHALSPSASIVGGNNVQWYNHGANGQPHYVTIQPQQHHNHGHALVHPQFATLFQQSPAVSIANNGGYHATNGNVSVPLTAVTHTTSNDSHVIDNLPQTLADLQTSIGRMTSKLIMSQFSQQLSNIHSALVLLQQAKHSGTDADLLRARGKEVFKQIKNLQEAVTAQLALERQHAMFGGLFPVAQPQSHPQSLNAAHIAGFNPQPPGLLSPLVPSASLPLASASSDELKRKKAQTQKKNKEKEKEREIEKEKERRREMRKKKRDRDGNEKSKVIIASDSSSSSDSDSERAGRSKKLKSNASGSDEKSKEKGSRKRKRDANGTADAHTASASTTPASANGPSFSSSETKSEKEKVLKKERRKYKPRVPKDTATIATNGSSSSAVMDTNLMGEFQIAFEYILSNIHQHGNSRIPLGSKLSVPDRPPKPVTSDYDDTDRRVTLQSHLFNQYVFESKAVANIMRRALPEDAVISDEARNFISQATAEFVAFFISESEDLALTQASDLRELASHIQLSSSAVMMEDEPADASTQSPSSVPARPEITASHVIDAFCGLGYDDYAVLCARHIQKYRDACSDNTTDASNDSGNSSPRTGGRRWSMTGDSLLVNAHRIDLQKFTPTISRHPCTLDSDDDTNAHSDVDTRTKKSRRPRGSKGVTDKPVPKNVDVLVAHMKKKADSTSGPNIRRERDKASKEELVNRASRGWETRRARQAERVALALASQSKPTTSASTPTSTAPSTPAAASQRSPAVSESKGMDGEVVPDVVSVTDDTTMQPNASTPVIATSTAAATANISNLVFNAAAITPVSAPTS